jgi:hypothetical protein
MKRKRSFLLFGLLVLLVLGAVYWRLTAAPPSRGEAAGDGVAPVPVDAARTEVDPARRPLLGTWQDDYKGKRTMILNADGTGTMWVELSGASAFLFAPKLRFDMKWSLDGQTLKMKTMGGDPADKVNMILNTMGDSAADTILEVTADRLLLLDKDGETKYDWRRAKPDEAGKK